MHTSKKSVAKRKVSAAEFDRAFDRGAGFEVLDLETATVRAPTQRINIDVPKHLLHRIDNEAHRIGVPRASVIKLWISEKVSELTAEK